MHTPTKKNVEIFLAKRCTNCIDYTLFRYPKIHLFFPLCLSENKKNRVLLIRWFARNFNSNRSRIIKTCNASLWFIQFLLFKIRFAHQFNKYRFKNYYSISVGRSLQYKQNYLFKFEFQVCRNCNYLFILFTLSFFFFFIIKQIQFLWIIFILI